MSETPEIDHNSIDHDAPFDKPLKASLSEITLQEAQYALEAGLEKCRQLDIACAVVVVDTHGFVVAFARMDGTRHMTENIATGRAKIAAFWGLPSKNLQQLSQRIMIASIDDFSNMGASQGGMPLYRNGEIVGGIGCSGGHGVGGLGLPDDEVARHAAAKFAVYVA